MKLLNDIREEWRSQSEQDRERVVITLIFLGSILLLAILITI